MHRGIVDGGVLTDTMLDDPRPGVLLAAGVLFVAFGRLWGQPDATHAWVDINGASATAAATRALIEAGLAPVGWLGWPDGSGLGADRRSGWWDAVGAEGVHLEEAAEEGIAEGRDAMAALLERGARSVVCASDSLASGAALALQDRGEDLGTGVARVVGFDNTPPVRFLRFTSVEQPIDEAAHHCVALLLAEVGGHRRRGRHRSS